MDLDNCVSCGDSQIDGKDGAVKDSGLIPNVRARDGARQTGVW